MNPYEVEACWMKNIARGKLGGMYSFALFLLSLCFLCADKNVISQISAAAMP